MAVPTGQVSLSDIATEYGGSAPHAMSEYYGKGNAAGSGQMLLHANFQGTSNIFTFNISSGANKNFRTLAVAAGWDGSAIPQGTLTSGQILSSGSTGSYAFVINGSLPSGSKFINNGTIVGRGGNGGSSSGNDRNCITGGGSTGSGTSAGPALTNKHSNHHTQLRTSSWWRWWWWSRWSWGKLLWRRRWRWWRHRWLIRWLV